MAAADTDARIQRFEAMVKQFPESELPRFSLAQAYAAADRLEEAERAYAGCSALKPDWMMAWLGRAEALVALGRYEEARPVAERALALAVAQSHQEPKAACEALLERIDEAQEDIL